MDYNTLLQEIENTIYALKAKRFGIAYGCNRNSIEAIKEIAKLTEAINDLRQMKQKVKKILSTHH